MHANFSLEDYFKGTFVTSPVTIKQKLRNIKAFVFDWDGVFNNGHKNVDGHSSFSEVDSMGINLMRFSHYLVHKQLPVTAVISGENNQIAANFVKRESFNANYSKVAHKEKALQHLCSQHNISVSEVMFMFDDVLDLSIAKQVGLRFMIGRTANPLLLEFANDKRMVDYFTQHDGNNNAIREVTEMIMAISNNFELAIDHRINFSEQYQAYINLRNQTDTQFFTIKEYEIVQS